METSGRVWGRPEAVHVAAYYAPAADASIFFLRLKGRMSVHTPLMWSRHSCFVPLLPASFQPRAFSRSAGQMEYCSSWLTTTLQIVVSSCSSVFIFSLLHSFWFRGLKLKF